MRYKKSLLYASLIQVPGVSAKQEQRYWEKGIEATREAMQDEGVCASRKQLELEEYRAMSSHPDEQETADSRSYADAVIENNGSFEEFYEKLDAFLGTI